jgi:hypothetical protein
VHLLAFEGHSAREFAYGKARFAEPAAEVRFFDLSLRVVEAAQGDDAVADKSGIGSEDHIW